MWPISYHAAVRVLDALEKLEDKRLAFETYCEAPGLYCAVGAVYYHEFGVVLSDWEVPYAIGGLSAADHDKLTELNDLLGSHESEESRYARVYQVMKELVDAYRAKEVEDV